MDRRIPTLAFAVSTLLLCGIVIAPPAPVVRPFGDNANWVAIEDMEYIIGTTNDRIVVPRGFVTDFASIPQPLWGIGLSPHGQYSRAAVIHDFLYWSQGCTRLQADRLLLIAMKESDVGAFDEVVVFDGVRTGGWAAWSANKRERDRSLFRVIPEQYLKPPDPNMNWDTYRHILFSKGVRDPQFVAKPAYCKYGDSSDVPTATPSSAPAKHR